MVGAFSLMGKKKDSKTGPRPTSSAQPHPHSAWSASAPASVRDTEPPLLPEKAWRAWQSHLKNRHLHQTWASLLPHAECPLIWALDIHQEGSSPELSQRLQLLLEAQPRRLQKWNVEEQAAGWLADSAEGNSSRTFAWEALAWAYALPALAQVLEQPTWWAVWNRLNEVAEQATAIDLETLPLLSQMLGAELPLALGYLFPELATCEHWMDRAYQQLTAGLLALLDGEGLPLAVHLHDFRPLLACWTRCDALSRAAKQAVWDEVGQLQYCWMVMQALRWSHRDGRHALGTGPSSQWEPDLFEAALELGGDRFDRRAAKIALPWRGKIKAKAENPLPESAGVSDWSQVAMLRTGWTSQDITWAIRFDLASTPLECALGRRLLLAGEWKCDLRRDGQPVEIVGPWENTCFESDADGIYLELEAKLSPGGRIQRHLFAAHADRFLFAADAVMFDEPAKIEYRTRLPLAADARLQAMTKTREIGIDLGTHRVHLFPLGLPEWRSDLRQGDLRLTSDDTLTHLDLTQHIAGTALFVPWFIDLAPHSRRTPYTWRPVTVGQSFQVLRPDDAVAYRIQCGREQWLVYRSLSLPATRSVLGKNLNTEFLLARFTPTGQVETLVEIEGPIS